MTQSLKKEIENLVCEVLQELGHVDHRAPGTGPIHTGFPSEPLSKGSKEVHVSYIFDAHQHLGKSLERISIVVDELAARGHEPGDLVFVKDQIAQALQKFEQVIAAEYGEFTNK